MLYDAKREYDFDKALEEMERNATMKAKIVKAVERLGDDAYITVERKDYIGICFNDFDGFTDDWDEIERTFDDEEAVSAFVDMLKSECNRFERIWGPTDYYFDGFKVHTTFASFDV